MRVSRPGEAVPWYRRHVRRWSSVLPVGHHATLSSPCRHLVPRLPHSPRRDYSARQKSSSGSDRHSPHPRTGKPRTARPPRGDGASSASSICSHGNLSRHGNQGIAQMTSSSSSSPRSRGQGKAKVTRSGYQRNKQRPVSHLATISRKQSGNKWTVAKETDDLATMFYSES